MRKWLIIGIILILAGSTAWYFYRRSQTPVGEQPSGFTDFFNFGDGDPLNPTDSTLTQDTPLPIIAPQKASLFRQLTSQSVAGYSAFRLETTTSTPATTPKGKPMIQTTYEEVLRYVSQSSGYVYEIKNNDIPIQISNIYIPNIYEAYFADGGTRAILRFLRANVQTIASYSVPIPPLSSDGTRTQKDGTYLPDNISSLAISPDGKFISRITDERGTAVISSTTSTNTTRKELFRSPFHEWLVLWPSQKMIYLQTKASGLAEGFLYLVDTTDKRLTRVLGNTVGLTTSISPSGRYVLYSESTPTGFKTSLLSTKDSSVRSVGVQVLPEKCVWLKNEDLICAGGASLPSGIYPDDWYKGVISFSDQLFRIYTTSNTFDTLFSPVEDSSFDITNLQTNMTDTILYFIDKKTGFLWQFML